MTLDDRTLFIEHHTQIWNLRITSALHTSKHDLEPRSMHRQCSPSTYELQTIKPNVWFIRERLGSRLRLTKAQTLTADTGSSSLAAPAHYVWRCKNHHSASPKNQLSENPKPTSEGIARTPKQILATHNEATSPQHGGDGKIACRRQRRAVCRRRVGGRRH